MFGAIKVNVKTLILPEYFFAYSQNELESVIGATSR